MTKRLGGDHQGGYGSGITGGKQSASGPNGGGVMKYHWTGPAGKQTFGGQRPPMPDGYKGRVLYTSRNRRIGRQEGTGPQS